MKKCPECGINFTESNRGRPKLTCSRKCRNNYYERTRRPQKPKTFRNCKRCEAHFLVSKQNVRYCSIDCRKQQTQEAQLKNYYLLQAQKPDFKEIICSWCNKPVIVPSSFTQKIVSHPQCKEERLRKRQRRKSVGRRGYRAAIRSLGIEQLGDRDNWTCHICEQPVDPLLPCNDKQGATVDHVMPLSRGGSDELDNLKLAHWICNVRKSNKLEWKNA